MAGKTGRKAKFRLFEKDEQGWQDSENSRILKERVFKLQEPINKKVNKKLKKSVSSWKGDE